VVLSKDLIQLLGPIQLELLVQQALSAFDMANPSKAILLLAVRGGPQN